MAKLNSAASLEKLRQKLLAERDPQKLCVTICSGTGCNALGGEEVVRAFEK